MGFPKSQPEQVSEFVSSYMDGQPELVQKINNVLKSSAADGGISVGSICTGWGVAEMVLESINTAPKTALGPQARTTCRAPGNLNGKSYSANILTNFNYISV